MCVVRTRTGIVAAGALLIASTALGNGPGFQGLGDLPGGEFDSYAKDVSNDGATVVGMGDPDWLWEAYRWTSGGGMVGLGDLPGGAYWSEGWGVSADGSTVAGLSGSASGWQAYRWTTGSGMVGLGDLPGGTFDSRAYDISADGLTVVGRSSSTSGTEAFRWTSGGGMVGLGDLPGGYVYGQAFGVSADGSTVVGRGNSALSDEAFIWDEANGMRSLRDVLVNDFGLDLTGWTLLEARGISDDGLTIVGYGNNPVGFDEGWIATIPWLGPCIHGDMNGDSLVNTGDIALFIDVLLNLSGASPAQRCAADVNEDWSVDGQDIQSIVDLALP